jgi:hypothetical protein
MILPRSIGPTIGNLDMFVLQRTVEMDRRTHGSWDLPSTDPLGLSALAALRNSRLAFDLLLTTGQAGLS